MKLPIIVLLIDKTSYILVYLLPNIPKTKMFNLEKIIFMSFILHFKDWHFIKTYSCHLNFQ